MKKKKAQELQYTRKYPKMNQKVPEETVRYGFSYFLNTETVLVSGNTVEQNYV